MAGFKRPSFLKRQKEQKRMARQAAKREARLEKKERPESQEFGALEDLLGEKLDTDSNPDSEPARTEPRQPDEDRSA